MGVEGGWRPSGSPHTRGATVRYQSRTLERVPATATKKVEKQRTEGPCPTVAQREDGVVFVGWTEPVRVKVP